MRKLAPHWTKVSSGNLGFKVSSSDFMLTCCLAYMGVASFRDTCSMCTICCPMLLRIPAVFLAFKVFYDTPPFPHATRMLGCSRCKIYTSLKRRIGVCQKYHCFPALACPTFTSDDYMFNLLEENLARNDTKMSFSLYSREHK